MRLAALIVAILAGVVGLFAAAPAVPFTATCAAAGSHHAAIVVQHEGVVIQRCVAFDGDSITGEQLLARSGIEYGIQTFGGFGDAICQVDNVPAQYTECLGKDMYWAYFVERAGASWQYSSVGMSNVALRDGDAEGFRYLVTGSVPAAPPAPAACTSTPSPTPTPPPVRTPVPATPLPRTPAPTVEPTGSAATPSIESTASAGPTPTSNSAASTAPSASASPSTSTPTASASGSGGSTSPSNSGGSGGSTSGPDPGVMAAGAAGLGLLVLVLARSIARRRPGP